MWFQAQFLKNKKCGEIIPKPDQRRESLLRVVETLQSAKRKKKFQGIFKNRSWGSSETVSGAGSEMRYTGNIRKLVGFVLENFPVKTMVDSPCGDCNWQWAIPGLENITYLGVDIVDEIIKQNRVKYANMSHMRFETVDFSVEPFPVKPDVVMCRDMLQHNSFDAAFKAIMKIEDSGARFLLTNWHHHPLQSSKDSMDWNQDITPGGYYKIDVMIHPFNFSKPLMFICEGPNGVSSDGKCMGVFKLPVLGLGDGTQFIPTPDQDSRCRNNVVVL
jgi:hypothetical protein